MWTPTRCPPSEILVIPPDKSPFLKGTRLPLWFHCLCLVKWICVHCLLRKYHMTIHSRVIIKGNSRSRHDLFGFVEISMPLQAISTSLSESRLIVYSASGITYNILVHISRYYSLTRAKYKNVYFLYLWCNI